MTLLLFALVVVIFSAFGVFGSFSGRFSTMAAALAALFAGVAVGLVLTIMLSGDPIFAVIWTALFSLALVIATIAIHAKLIRGNR
jgi:hypothetical protein